MALEMTKILEGLEFFPENIERNLNLTHGLVMAERLMIALTDEGVMGKGKAIGRQEAHELVRTLAQKAFREKKELKALVKEKKLLPERELDIIFDPKTYIGCAEKIVEEATRD
jgi:adenylosuccinate lyase